MTPEPDSLRALFDRLRHDPAHHLGMGDIRLTMGQQDEIADAWEATEALVNHNAEKVCEYFDQWEADNYAHAVEVAAKDVLIAALRDECQVLRQRLEEAETALGMLSIERDIAAVEADMHTTDGTTADDRSKEG